MASRRSSRAERLGERLRGAQRANVDESFNLDLGGLDIPSSTSPAAEAPSSSRSFKAVNHYSDAMSAALHTPASSARRRLSRRQAGSRDPYDLPETSKESSPPNRRNGTRSPPRRNQDETPMAMTAEQAALLSTVARSAVSRTMDPVPNELEPLPTPLYVQSSFRLTSPIDEPMADATPLPLPFPLPERVPEEGPTQAVEEVEVEEVEEEVEESPADAPGSGKRRKAPASSAANEQANYSARSLRVVSSDRTGPASSSPSERRLQRSNSMSFRGSTMSVARLGLLEEVDESRAEAEEIMEQQAPQDAEPEVPGSDDLKHVIPDTEAEDYATTREEDAEPIKEQDVAPEPEPRKEPEPEPEPEPEQTEDQPRGEQEEEPANEGQNGVVEPIEATEPVQSPGRKRRRSQQQEKSPELGSASADELAKGVEQPAPKRTRTDDEPAAQKQPRISKKRTEKLTASTAPSAPPAPPKEKSGEKSGDEAKTKNLKTKSRRKKLRPPEDEGDEDADGNGDGTIEVTAQRFVYHKRRAESDGDEMDPLHAEIPFANRGGESVMDAFAQVCDEIMTSTMAQFREVANDAGSDAAKQKECRIKMRAIEAFREELNSRLLSHIIHLNHWHSLRRRLRHAQKEKHALRDEILRIRSEREQVALRMDAIRIKHEADTKESTYCLDASTLMHDVDLAVEQGRDADELTGKPQREAELANLELLVSRISQEASSAHASGGMLKQVKDFNAFLERAAIALESR